jgi:hypothetical protein
MLNSLLSWAAVGLLLVTSAGLFLYTDWRWGLAFLALQYVSVFWLVAQHWPAGMAAAKLVSGWMATASLGISLINLQTQETPSPTWPPARSFRLFMVAMVSVAAIAAAPRLEAEFPGLGIPVAIGGGLLIGMGLLQLGTTSQLLRVLIGLLSVLAGFEIVYAAMEGSVLVAALLASINLGLGLVGAYLLNATEQPA